MNNVNQYNLSHDMSKHFPSKRSLVLSKVSSCGRYNLVSVSTPSNNTASQPQGNLFHRLYQLRFVFLHAMQRPVSWLLALLRLIYFWIG